MTIVTQNRACLFGRIIDGEMILNAAGKMIDEVCGEVENFLPNVEIIHYQIMPNHFHVMFLIDNDHLVGADLRVCPQELYVPNFDRVSLSTVVQRFKSLTTRRYIDGVKKSNWQRFDKHLWQRNYYEHVVRDENDFHAIVDYIEMNPQNWEKDEEYHPGL